MIALISGATAGGAALEDILRACGRAVLGALLNSNHLAAMVLPAARWRFLSAIRLALVIPRPSRRPMDTYWFMAFNSYCH